jgi:hypothetical protein
LPNQTKGEEGLEGSCTIAVLDRLQTLHNAMLLAFRTAEQQGSSAGANGTAGSAGGGGVAGLSAVGAAGAAGAGAGNAGGAALGAAQVEPVVDAPVVNYLTDEAVRCAFSDRNLHSRNAIELHAFAPVGASRRVTDGIPLGSSLLLPVHTVNCIQTLKVVAQKLVVYDRTAQLFPILSSYSVAEGSRGRVFDLEQIAHEVSQLFVGKSVVAVYDALPSLSANTP